LDAAFDQAETVETNKGNKISYFAKGQSFLVG